MINYFNGINAFLSNFTTSPISDEFGTYLTVEHYFQAKKAVNKEDFLLIINAPTPGKAKQLGKKITLRQDWEEVKDQIMLEGLRKKFSIPEFKKMLLLTGDEELIEGNYWGDTYWGVSHGKGQNKLGKLLMQVREEIKGSN